MACDRGTGLAYNPTPRRFVYVSLQDLCDRLASEVDVQNAVPDGEVVCLESTGRSDFHSLLRRRETAYFYAFDLLFLNGSDGAAPAAAAEGAVALHHPTPRLHDCCMSIT